MSAGGFAAGVAGLGMTSALAGRERVARGMLLERAARRAVHGQAARTEARKKRKKRKRGKKKERKKEEKEK